MEAPIASKRPVIAEEASKFILLERAVEEEFRPLILAELQHRVEAVAETAEAVAPDCPRCGKPMRRKDTRPVSWIARVGRLRVPVTRYRCKPCGTQRRPLLEQLGVEAGRICGSLARRLALLAIVAPYPLAAQLAWWLLGVKVSAMGVWRVAQRLGQAAADYSEGVSNYHADSRSAEIRDPNAPQVVVLSTDGCMLGMQVRAHRRQRKDGEKLPPLPPVADGQFREVKTGVLLLPEERVEISPGRRSVVRRILVSCLGDADAIFRRLYAQMRELGWLDTRKTLVVIVGDGAEWIWNRATWFVRRCEILDFWHALEHAWEFARLRYGDGSVRAEQWVHTIAEDLRAGKVEEVIARLKRLRPKTAEMRESLAGLIRYYSENVSRMKYDEYLRLGYGIGSGAVESAHKQVIHARMRQAGMRWSEAGARRLLALRLLLLNQDWSLLDRLRMSSLA
jgi:transposase-like protein